MSLPRNNNLVQYAQQLRINLTEMEKKLWYEFLSTYPIPFVYQKIIGNYIVDFYCRRVRISIEIDGSQHFTDKALEYDARRTLFLEIYEIKELRFTNYEINNNFEEVCECIHQAVENRRNDVINIPLMLVKGK